MNCATCQNLIGDYARNRVHDATAQREIEKHTDDCLSCERKLVGEFEIDARLRAFVAQTKACGASDETANLLRQSFRAHVNAASVASGESEVSIAYLAAMRAGKRGALRRNLMLAVPLLFCCAMSFAVWRFDARQNHARNQSSVTETPNESLQKTVSIAPLSETQAVDETVKSNIVQVSHTQPNAAGKYASLDKRRTFNSRSSKPIRKRSVKPENDLPESGYDEIATGFLPLQDAQLNALESGQIVRVELPRSALASFGLPLNADRTASTIKADVVVGNDGTAHAIRFVR